MPVEPPNGIAPQRDELDGALILGAALRYGLSVEVYPRQVVATIEPTDINLSFVHGIPGSSGLGPVTYAQDKRMRRALMERAGIPVPRGATFTMGRGVPGAINFAEQLAFPVTISPAIGDNGIESFRRVRSRDDMERTLRYLRTPPSEREGFTRAAYGLTELREPGVEDGQLVVPPGYMFMVQKDIPGVYLRALVVGQQVVSAVQYHDFAAAEGFAGGTEILEDVHPTIASLAQRAAGVIPGLALAAVDLVVQDPLEPAEGQEIAVVEFSERPDLWVQDAIDSTLGRHLAERIVLTYSEGSGHRLPPPRDRVTVAFEAHAVPDVASCAEDLTAAAFEVGLAVGGSSTDPVAGVVRTSITGDPTAIAHLTDALLAGKVTDQPVMLAVLAQTDEAPLP